MDSGVIRACIRHRAAPIAGPVGKITGVGICIRTKISEVAAAVFKPAIQQEVGYIVADGIILVVTEDANDLRPGNER